MHRVGMVARMAGVSVRTLRHYDSIGLLRPALFGTNGYRLYGRNELLRLQQILIHRELGIPLERIGDILDAPGFDRLAALREQRERIAAEAERLAGMLRTIDRTIASLTEEETMTDSDLYRGIVDPARQAGYEAWLESRHGPAVRDDVTASRAHVGARSAEERDAAMKELRALEQGLAQGLRDGTAAGSPALDPLVERHRAWVSAAWNRPVPPAAYACLADTYLAHPDFVARYEAIEPGFAEYLAATMRGWAARQA